MTLPSHPPSGGTRLHRSSPWWRLHVKRFAIYYAVVILILFLWSGNLLKLSLKMNYQDQQPVARVRGIHPTKKQRDILSKLPPWNAQQHSSASISLTGAFSYRGENCQTTNQQQCQGQLFFPAVDLKTALAYDEAMDMFRGIQRNGTLPSVTKSISLYKTHAVLTRGGNKDFVAAGSVTANQDRVLLLQTSPHNVVYEKKHDFIMALLDGHGTYGHVVSHHAAVTLAPVLSKHLLEANQSPQDALTKTFLEIDDTIPTESYAGAGSTAIVMLRLQDSLYIANTGDSLAFVASYDDSNNKVEIVYETKPHKPNLPEERTRIEAAGGEVVEAQSVGDSSRVIIPMNDGMVMALAMSRSIGDKEGTHLGVIPNPTIDTLDLNGLAVGKELFAVAASDGLFDRVPPQEVAETLAKSYFGKGDTVTTPLEACEELIMKSSYGWISNGSPYRDDISVATTILERE